MPLALERRASHSPSPRLAVRLSRSATRPREGLPGGLCGIMVPHFEGRQPMPTPQEYAEFFEVLEMVRPNGGTLPKPPVESRRPDLSPEEIQQRFNEFFDDMASRPAPPPRRLRSLLRSAGKAATGGPSRLTERSHLMRPALRRFPTCGLRSFDGGGLPCRNGAGRSNLTCLPVFSHEREYKKNSETAPSCVRASTGRSNSPHDRGSRRPFRSDRRSKARRSSATACQTSSSLPYRPRTASA